MQRAREDAGLDQASAAEQLGIHAVTLSRYETGKRAIPEELRDRMRALYRIPESPEQPSAVNQEADPRVWHGEMRATLRTLSGMQTALAGLLEMTEAATQSVRGLVESGVLLQGGQSPVASPTSGSAGTAARDMTAEEFFAEMERRGIRPEGAPRRLPAAG